MGDGAMKTAPNSEMIGNDSQKERSKLIDLASAAMDELIKMADSDSHLWIKSPKSGKEVLNPVEYEKIRSPFNTPKPNGFVTEATRKTVLICTNTAALIETFLDA
ncbi:homeobox-leucine zipper protein ANTHOCYANINLESS 2-like, partial [Trifolium medium]|nr:homeobox-leucine zipper protein ANTHOCYANINLESS 2-like [Trifolium medium]